MARIHGRKGRLYVGIASDTATAEAVAFLNNWALNFAVDNVEVTAFGDANKVFVAGLPDASGTYSGFYDDATVQLFTAAKDGKARKFYLYPSTDDTAEYFFGTALFDFSVTGATDAAVSISGNLQAASEVSKVPAT